MLHYLPLCNEVNRPHAYICPVPLGPPARLPQLHPSRSPQGLEPTPCAIEQAPTSYLLYTRWCGYVQPNLSIPPTLPFPHCIHMSVAYVCVSISALEIVSSVPFS